MSYLSDYRIKQLLGKYLKSGNIDPTVTAIDGEPGDLYLRDTGTQTIIYKKQDSGSSTSWVIDVDDTAAPLGPIRFASPTGSAAGTGSKENPYAFPELAIAALREAGVTPEAPGIVICDAGVFASPAEVDEDVTNIHIMGMGPDKTIWEPVDNERVRLRYNPQQVDQRHLEVSDMTINRLRYTALTDYDAGDYFPVVTFRNMIETGGWANSGTGDTDGFEGVIEEFRYINVHSSVFIITGGASNFCQGCSGEDIAVTKAGTVGSGTNYGSTLANCSLLAFEVEEDLEIRLRNTNSATAFVFGPNCFVNCDAGSVPISPIDFEDGATSAQVFTVTSASSMGFRYLTSAATAGGGTSEALEVVGLPDGAAVFAVTPLTPGANRKAMVGFEVTDEDEITIQFESDPGAGATYLVLFHTLG